MQAATAVYFNARPPTFNTLDSHQRTRLIRSTRKLGDVLGTTPQLVETDSPLSPPTRSSSTDCPPRDRKRRQGSIFEYSPAAWPFTYDYASSSASSSASSLAIPRGSMDSSESDSGMSSHSLPSLPTPKSFARHVRDKSRSKGKRTPLPTPLVLRLNAVPLPPSDPRLHPTSPKTPIPSKAATLAPPTATNLNLPLTPTTPLTPSTPTAAETRRKRLAKLKRTLGENVPLELISPFRSTPRTQLSSPIDPPPAPVITSPPPAPFRPAKSSRSQQNENHYATLRPAPKDKKERAIPSPFAHSLPGRGARKRSLSVDFRNGFNSSVPAAPTTPSPPWMPMNSQTSTSTKGSRSHSRSPSHSPSPLSSATEHTCTYTDDEGGRSSQVWVTGTGEWNRKDIREVQHQLRNLKLR
ncbi:hypothetical protein C8Q74DRAFT_1215115 [Fomes fomentarius]|nr:hypothetical protein C8Q74DRAFT_1215115 [Fomes fomentarius]